MSSTPNKKHTKATNSYLLTQTQSQSLDEVSHIEKPKHLNTIKHLTVPKTGIPTGLIILAIISIPILTYRRQ